MASLLDEILTPGWSTSKPGDMKNSGGLRQLGGAMASAAATSASSAMASLSTAGTIGANSFPHIEALSKVSVHPEADKPQTSDDAW